MTLQIEIVSKRTHDSVKNVIDQVLVLKEPSVIILNVNANEVLGVKPNGTDVLITLKNGKTIVLEDFFDSSNHLYNSTLVFKDDKNELIWVQFTDQNTGLAFETVQYGKIQDIEPFLFVDGSPNLLPWLFVPLTVGSFALLANDGKQTKNIQKNYDFEKNDGSEISFAPSNILSVNPIEANTDSKIEGFSESGSIVTVTFPDNSIVSIVVEGDGAWSIDTPNLKAGDAIEVTATDVDGEFLDKSIVTVDADKTAPSAPIIDPIEANTDSKIEGRAEAGSTVRVSFPDKTSTTVIVGSDGKWTVDAPNLQAGDEVKVVATDTAGNTSAETKITVDADKTAPSAPIIDPIEANTDSKITGEAEAGSTVRVSFLDKTSTTVIVGSDGKWTVDAPSLKAGDEVKVTATDAAGNTSAETKITVDADATAPSAPIIDPIEANTDSKITGKAEVGSTVRVNFPDKTSTTVIVGSDGKWTVDAPSLKAGDEVKVTATDVAGNTSAESTIIVDADATAPSAPVIHPIEANTDSKITGESEAGSTVRVNFPDKTSTTVIVGSDGKWTVDEPSLKAGDEVKVTATDAAGNTSSESAITVGADKTPPSAPVIHPIEANTDSKITGKAEAGSAVSITLPNNQILTVVVGSDGKWTVDAPSLKAGDEVKVTATDATGNTSTESSIKVEADKTAPNAPVIQPIEANTDTKILGQAEVNSIVTISLLNNVVSVVANSTGAWSISNPGLSAGDEVRVTATDAAGNTSLETTITVDADATAPSAPVIHPIEANTDSRIEGRAEAGSTVTVTLPNNQIVTVVVGSDGNWGITNPSLKAGDEVKVTATDAAGNTSTETKITVDADKTAPNAPVIYPIEANTDTQIEGRAEANSTVTITLPNKVITAITNSTGAWSITNPGLKAGDEVKVTATDAAGNTSDSSKITVDADKTAPSAPVIYPVEANTDSKIEGRAEAKSIVTITLPNNQVVTTIADATGAWTISNPNLKAGDDVKVTATDVAGNRSVESRIKVDADKTAPIAPSIRPIEANTDSKIEGRAEANSTVTITLPNNQVVTTIADVTGAWSISNPSLKAGDEVKVTATDAAGNTSDSSKITVSADKTAPSTPVIYPVEAYTDSTITGRAEANSIVTISLPNNQVVTTIADGKGAWSINNPDLKADDVIKVTATDAAGNTSAESSIKVDADKTAPSAPLIHPIEANTDSQIEGRAEASSTVSITLPNNQVVTTIADVTGAWSITNSSLKAGDEVKVTATDAAGNTSLETKITVDADKTAPSAPVIHPIEANTDSQIEGRAEAGSTVTITLPDNQILTVVADTNGRWSVGNPDLKAGDEVKVTATDAAGNISSESKVTVDIDKTAPNVPVIYPIAANISNTIDGQAEANSTVTITLPNNIVVTTIADAAGIWSIANPDLSAGDEVKVTATDAAGNTSNETKVNVDVGKIILTTPVIYPIEANTDSKIEGRAEAGSIVTVTYLDHSIVTVVVANNGTWSVDNPGLNAGDEVKAIATDAAGNTSAERVIIVDVDKTAPSAPVIHPIEANTDSQIEGRAEPDSIVTVSYSDKSSVTTVVDNHGRWSIKNPGLKVGDEVKVTATDAAGNTSDESKIAVGADKTPPSAPVIHPIEANTDRKIEGRAEAGSTVTVTYPDKSTVIGLVDNNGRWSVDNPGLTAGDKVTVKAVDAAGNASAESAITVGVDKTPPSIPIIYPIEANTDSKIIGEAEASSIVRITYPDSSSVTVVVGSDGKWSVDAPNLKAGDTVKAKATDAAGNTSDEGKVTVDVDKTPPSAPVIHPIEANTDSQITGEAEVGSTIKVIFPNNTIATVIVGSDGKWSVDNQGLKAGDEVKVTATDAADNTSSESRIKVGVDKTAPTIPVIHPIEANTDNKITGEAEANSKVTIKLPNNVVITTIADGTGAWSIGNPSLKAGDEVKVTATDAAGNTSEERKINVDVDKTAPTVPVIHPIEANTDRKITGEAEVGSTVRITYPDNSSVTVVVGIDGKWSVDAPNLKAGDEVKVTATDAAGNTSIEAKIIVDADQTAPVATAQIVNFTDNQPVNVGEFNSNALTNDTTPTLNIHVTGVLTADEHVAVYRDHKKVGQATWVSVGRYQFEDTSLTEDASYAYTVAVEDSTGNQGTHSPAFIIRLDTTGPSVEKVISIDSISQDTGFDPKDFITNDTSLTIYGSLLGTLDSDETAQISIDGGLNWANLLVSAGSWKYVDSRTLANQDYTYLVRVVDQAGNIGSTDSQVVVVNTTLPVQSVRITSYSDDVGLAQGNFGLGTTTDDSNPVLNGTISAELATDEKVAIYSHNYEGSVSFLGYAVVEGTQWSYKISTDLKDNTSYVFNARVEDNAGNVGASSPDFGINVDLLFNINSQSTLDTTPIITGSSGFRMLPGEYLEVSVGGQTYSSKNGAVVVDPLNNTWYVQIPTPLAKGVTYNVTAILKAADNTVIAQDDTVGELVIGNNPAAPVIPSSVDASFKPTAITMENGIFQMYINGSLISQNPLDITRMLNFISNTLNNTTDDSAGSATFMDFDRDGDMDIFAIDNEWRDGQQAFERKSFDGSSYASKGVEDITNIDWYGFQVGTTLNAGYQTYGDYVNTSANSPFSANVWVINGGIAAFDKVGDGYVDLVVGDSFLGDGQSGGGVESSFVMNDRLQGGKAYFYKDNAYGSGLDLTSSNAAKVISQLNGVSSNLTQDQLGTRVGIVDLDGNGTVDIIGSSGTVFSPTFQIDGYAQTERRDWGPLMVVNNKGNGELSTKQILTDGFLGSTTNYYNASVTFADFDGDGDFDFYNTQTGFILNHNGVLSGGAADSKTGVQAANVINLQNSSTDFRGSIAVDWNGDGKMDIIAMTRADLPSKGVKYFQNNTPSGGSLSFTDQVWNEGNTTNKGTWSNGATKIRNSGFSGGVVADFDFDGDQDFMAFSTSAGSYFVENTDVNFDGQNSGVIHLRILDQEGINALFGNTVRLFDAQGNLVASQILNPQSGNQTNDSTALVSFYGLDKSKTYSAQILRNIGGNEAHVGAANLGGKNITAINEAWTQGVSLPKSAGATANTGIGGINASWGNLKTANPWDAYVLTAENQTATFNANKGNGIVGTGYNDTFFATRGDDKFDGAGGTKIVSGERVWSPTGGLDIVDYKLAGLTAITVDLSISGAQNTGFGTATFMNIEGIAGSLGDDKFTGDAGDNYFEGRGGNDLFDLSKGGQDTLMYKILSASNATGGNGSDTVIGFKVGTVEATPNADIIDVKSLLVGYTADADGAAHYINGVPTIDEGETIEQYLNVVVEGNNTLVQIDRHGGSHFTTLVTLNNVQTDLQTLLANHQIII